MTYLQHRASDSRVSSLRVVGSFQGQRRLEKWSMQQELLFDRTESCKFPTEKTVGAQKFNFATSKI